MGVFDIIGGVLKTAARVAGIKIGGDASSVLDKAAEILSQVKDTPEFRLESMKHEEELRKIAVAEMEVANQESIAMIASEDKWVKRARPIMLYAATAITVILCFMVGIAALNETKIDLGVVGAIVSLMTPLWGVSGTYVYRRSTEKIVGASV